MKRKFIQCVLKYLAKLVLWRYKPLVIGVTGSVGKTSTKEAIYAVLKKQFRVERNIFNLNTEIGMPLTIIQGKDAKRNIFLWFYNFFYFLWLFIYKSKKYPEVLVLEMSEDAPGTIKYLVDLAHPKIGVITFIGDPPVHLKYYKNINHFIEEISYLPQRLLLDGKFIFNIDNNLVLGLKEKTMAKTFSYGFNERADVKISNYKLVTIGNDLRKAGMSFRIEHKGSFVPVKLKGVIGKPQAYALAAAAAVGLSLEMNLVEIAEAMKDYQIPLGRTKLVSGIEDSWVLDDTYNACPDSVLAALDLIKDINAKRRIAILGDMKELGDFSKQAHELIGEKVSEIADIFIAVGKEMMSAKDIVIEKNSKIEVFCFENSEEAKKYIKKMIQKGDLILVKGSRAMEMERITKGITA